MYIGIDVGGTKTLVALLDAHGTIKHSEKFPTPQNYQEFLKELKTTLDLFDLSHVHAACIAVPAPVDTVLGIVPELSNLSWVNVPVRDDVAGLLNCPVAIENDANLAALSEAMLVKHEYNKVLYVTVSTGIGGGVITNQKIDANLRDCEPGHMVLEHDGVMNQWESFASGKSIKEKYNMYARDIEDPEAWQAIAENIAKGLLVLSAVLRPEIIIIGGSIGTHFAKYQHQLVSNMKQYEHPQTHLSEIISARRPEEAVVYGCYDLAKQLFTEV